MLVALLSFAVAAPLELDQSAPAEWCSAVLLAGFELGPCVIAPCARLTRDELWLRLPDEGFQQVAFDSNELDLSLAMAISRLSLSELTPLVQTPVALTSPLLVAPPAVVSVEAVSAPPPVAVEEAPRRRIALREHTPALFTTVAFVPRARRASAVAPDILLPPSETPAPAKGLFGWMAVSVGAHENLETPMITGQGGVEWGAWWVGGGGRFNGDLTADVGAGRSLNLGKLTGRVGLWAGAMTDECSGCTNDQTGGDEDKFLEEIAWNARWNPVARAEAEIGAFVSKKVVITPRISVVYDTIELKPEVAVAFRWVGG